MESQVVMPDSELWSKGRSSIFKMRIKGIVLDSSEEKTETKQEERRGKSQGHKLKTNLMEK